MKIIIYGINYSPELIGIGKYTSEMCNWLAKQGHEVRVITAPPYYPDWKVSPKYSQWFYSREMISGATIWRCPLYVPLRPSALLRLLHLASFAFTSIPALFMQLFWRPKIIFLVAPTLFCAPEALLFAKLTGAKSILHIQDFEADAFLNLNFFYGASKTKRSALNKIIFWFESLMLRSFDVVSTISTGMMQRAIDKGAAPESLRFLPNWSEISRFQNIVRSKELLHQLGVDDQKKVILYSGNIGEKQGLEIVILAAQRLQQRLDLIFLLVGEGSGKDHLHQMMTDLKLVNVVFAPLQTYEVFPSLLASADVHLVIQKRGFADAVLPSKLSNILAAGGNAVITAEASTTLGKLSTDHPGIAVVVEPESVNDLISGIEQALTMPRQNLTAESYAHEFLDKEQILSRFYTELKI